MGAVSKVLANRSENLVLTCTCTLFSTRLGRYFLACKRHGAKEFETGVNKVGTFERPHAMVPSHELV